MKRGSGAYVAGRQGRTNRRQFLRAGRVASFLLVPIGFAALLPLVAQQTFAHEGSSGDPVPELVPETSEVAAPDVVPILHRPWRIASGFVRKGRRSAGRTFVGVPPRSNNPVSLLLAAPRQLIKGVQGVRKELDGMFKRQMSDVRSSSASSHRHPAIGVSWFHPPADPGQLGASFFLMVQDYSWALRYYSSRLLDADRPLELEWVKLKQPLHKPTELGEGAFQWDERQVSKRDGFQYRVKRAVEAGVEIIINFIDGQGVTLLVQKNGQLKAYLDESPTDMRAITHGWVQTISSFIPVPRSISLYNFHDRVYHFGGPRRKTDTKIAV
mmetsp:Transcript_22065/g.50426  ORF Transcript_22065/g.50426 Transcript_22065/m.50426 type:complete len:326 (+) Transcript_22065:21-998(+)